VIAKGPPVTQAPAVAQAIPTPVSKPTSQQ